MSFFSTQYSTIVFHDIETTGVTIGQDQVVEFAAVTRSKDEAPREVSFLVTPTIPIPPEASAVHGITDDRVRGAGPIEGRVEQFRGLFQPGVVVSGYNVRSFDNPFLNAECVRVGVPPLVDGHPVVDVIDLVRYHLRALRSRKLVDVVAALGLPEFPAHEALADVSATAGLLRHLVMTEVVPRELSALVDEAAQISTFLDTESAQWSYYLYQRPGEPLCLGFGKYCGTPVNQAPSGYYRSIREFFAKNAAETGAALPPLEVQDLFKCRERGQEVSPRECPQALPPVRKVRSTGKKR